MRAPLPGAYWILWLGAFVNRLGGFVFTFLPLYLTARRGFSIAAAGGVVALYGAGAMIAALLGGILADHLGRRRTMLWGMTAGALAMLALGQAESVGAIAIGTFVLGLLSDLYRPAQSAAIADLVPESERLRAYGYLYWAVNLAFSGAMIIAGMLAAVDFKWLFIGDAATTLVCVGMTLYGVPETRTQAPQKSDGGWTRPWRDRAFVWFAAAQLPLVLVFMQSQTALSLDMRAHGISPQTFGRLVALNGILIVILQPLVIRWFERAEHRRMLAAGALFVGLGFGLNAFVSSIAGYATGIVLWTLGELAFSATVPALIAQLSPPSLRGRYQGANQTIWATAFCLAPALGTAVLERFGSQTLWIGCLAAATLSAILHRTVARQRFSC